MRALVLMALICGAVATACVPHVGHSPRVEAGPRYFVNGSFVHVASLQGEDAGVLPSLYLGGAHGWVHSNERIGASLGVQVPLFLLPFFFAAYDFALETFLSATLIDAYLQPVRAPAGGIEAGLGALASRSMFVPYVQLGALRDDGSGFFTTQAMGMSFREFDDAVYWLPTIAYRRVRPDGTRAADIYATAAVGQRHDFDDEREFFLSIGFVGDFMRRR